MTLFTLVLDMAINNARSIKSKLECGSDTVGDVVSFKRRLCEQLVLPLLHEKDEQKQLEEQQDRSRKKYKQPSIDDVLGTIIDNLHMLSSIKMRKDGRRFHDAHCYLCLVFSMKSKT
jgi:hypothetical protein